MEFFGSMDKKLLSILCCPITHKGLQMAKADTLKSLNNAILAGELNNRDGVALTEPLTDALITDDGKTLYPIKDGIPVLLEGDSVSVDVS